MPGKGVMPRTLECSPSEAQETWLRAYDRAIEVHGEGERARWIAYAALRNEFKRASDHWEPKSDKEPPKPRRTTARRSQRGREEESVRGGRDRCSPELLYLAKKLAIEQYDGLNRREVVDAIRSKFGLASREGESSARAAVRNEGGA